MKNEKFNKPTETELDILGILWKDGESTVGHVHEKLSKIKTKKIVYTTTLKLMQIMLDKGLVERNSSSRAHLYAAVVDQQAAQKHYVNKMINVVFSGSTKDLVLQALGSAKLSNEDLANIRSFINSRERK